MRLLFVFITCLFAGAACSSNISLVEEKVEQFRHSLAGIPQNFFDLELEIFGLDLGSNGTAFEEDVAAFRETFTNKIYNLVDELFEMEMTLHKFAEEDSNNDTDSNKWYKKKIEMLEGKLEQLELEHSEYRNTTEEKIQELELVASENQNMTDELGGKIQSLENITDENSVEIEALQLMASEKQNLTDENSEKIETLQLMASENQNTTDELGGKIQSLENITDENSVKIETLQLMASENQNSTDANRDNIEQIISDQLEIEDTVNELRSNLTSMQNELYWLTTCKWRLGMNLHPSDGHTMDYSTGWQDNQEIGTIAEALSGDYLNLTVWNTPANYISIVRHQDGIVDAVKVFQFAEIGYSLYERFDSSNDHFFRCTATARGPIQSNVADTATYMADDPIFSVTGDLVFNWGSGQSSSGTWPSYAEGVRIALSGGHLSEETSDDHNTRGIGGHLHCNPVTGVQGSSAYGYEISVIQDCPLSSSCWTSHNYKLMGTDHGNGYLYTSTAVYGQYAIYVSPDATTFPEPGSQLGTEMPCQ